MKLFWSSCVLLLLAPLLVSAGGQTEKKTTGGAATTQQAATLTFMTTADLPTFSASIPDVLTAFEQEMAKQGKQVKVNFNSFTGNNSDYAAKVTLMLRAGAGQVPDVLVEEIGRAADYMRSGYLLPLDQYIQSSTIWTNLFQAFKDGSQYNGKTYDLIFQTSACPLYFRKDLFQQAGLPENWQPKSWDDVISAAKTIKERLPDVTPLLYTGGSSADGGEQVTFSKADLLLHGAGGTVFDTKTKKWIVASKPLLDVFTFYQTITKLGLIDPQRGLSSDADNWAMQAFAQAKGAMLPYGSWAYDSFWGPGKPFAITDRAKVVGYTATPAEKPGMSVRGQDFVSQSGGWAYMIPAAVKKENAALAWDLISFLSQTDRQAAFNAGKGQVATRQDVIDSPAYQKNSFLVGVGDMLKYTYVDPQTDPGWYGVPETAMADAIGRIMIGQWTPIQAMKNFAQKVEQAYGKDAVEYDYTF